MANCDSNVPRGHQFAMAAYGSASGDAFTRRLACVRFGLKGATETVIDDGIQDSIWEQAGGEITTKQRVSGTIVHNPRPAELQDILRPIFGGAAFSSNLKLPGTICEYFQMGHMDPRMDRVYRYNNLVTSSAEFSASDSSPILQLSWNIEGQSRTILDPVSGNWPTLSLSQQQPFVFRQAIIKIGGVAYRTKSIRVNVNNNIQGDDFFNSLTRAEMPQGLQQITFTHEIPWDDEVDVDRISAEQVVTGEIQFLSGTKEFKLEFPSLFAIVDEPEIAGITRILNSITWKAKFDSTDPIAAPVRIKAVPM